MSYCLNPACVQPHNPDNAKFCLSCGLKLCLGDRYQAERILGRGGFGRTLLARDKQKPSHPPCVIKQLCPESGNISAKAAELFHQEALRLEELGPHPQIPDLYAYCDQDGWKYIVQEFIDGFNLAQALDQEGPFSPAAIAQLLANLLPVLDFVHQGQVIHRDIKPENIIRRRDDGLIMLVDFGAAKYETGGTGMTGTRIGSIGFTAPEQLLGKAVFASDLYGLGATCIYLLTGVSPSDLYDPLEDGFAWRQALPKNVQVPPRLGQLLDRLLAISLKSRYSDSPMVLRDLHQFLSPGSAPPVLPQPSAPRVFQSSDAPWPLVWRGSLGKHPIRSLAWSPHNQCLAWGNDHGQVGLFHLESGQTLWQGTHAPPWVPAIAMEKPAIVQRLVFNPQSTLLASAGTNTIINLWDCTSGKLRKTLRDHYEALTALRFSPEGHQLISYGGDRQIMRWQVDKNQPLEVRSLATVKAYPADFSPDIGLLALWGEDGAVHLFSLESGCLLAGWSLPDLIVESLQFSATGEYLLVIALSGSSQLWRVRDQTILGERLPPSPSTFSLDAFSLSQDSQWLFRGDQQGHIYLWSFAENTLVSTWQSGATITSLGLSYCQGMLATGHQNGELCFWQRPH